MSLPRLSLCLALACGPALASQAPVYGERLEGFDYAYPVHYLDFTSQGQPLSMAYLDVAPKKANGRTILLMHGKNFCAGTWEPARWTNWNSATTCCGFRPRPGPSRPS